MAAFRWLWLCVVLPGVLGQARAADPPPLPQKQEAAAIAQVRKSWRAMDGETADQIFQRLAGAVHFVPRGWEAGNDGQGGIFVAFDWLRHASDKKEDIRVVSFELLPDGGAKIADRDDQELALGWQAFALHLAQEEVDDDLSDASKQFLHNLANLDFIKTPQGLLGGLLSQGGCTLGDPVLVEYADTWGRETPVKGDYWRLQLSVDCAVPGPSYFTKDGVILFRKVGIAPWKPYSFFARRLADYAPGKWFDNEDPNEQQVFALVAEGSGKAGLASDAQADVVKSMELSNDGSLIHW